MTDPKHEPVAWPLGSYAPGNYMCCCMTCGDKFEGDKRALCCLSCSVIGMKASFKALTAQLDALKEENERLADALAFYAREDNWKDGGFLMEEPTVLSHVPCSVDNDGGNVARAALTTPQGEETPAQGPAPSTDVALDSRVAELEAEIKRLKSERGYIVGCNDGFEEAIDQAAATAYRTCAETRHVTLGDKAAAAIRALAATEGSADV